jgi:hypothetical protein
MNQQKPTFAIPALIAGVVFGVLSGLPLIGMINCACCILIIGGGVLATYLYLREYPSNLPPITYGEICVLGLLTGVIGGIVESIIRLPFLFLDIGLGLENVDTSELESILRQLNLPPETQRILMDLLSSSVPSVATFFFELIFNILIAAVFATIGAIIGLALFQKNAAPPAYQPPTGYQGPPPGQPGPPREQPGQSSSGNQNMS